DCPVWPGPRDGRKRYVLEQPAIASKTFERGHGVDLSELAARSLPIKPGEEACDSCAVADLRRARTGDLDLVLDCLHQAERAGRLDDSTAMTGDEARQCIGSGALVDPHAVLSLAQILERPRESGRFAQIGECLDGAADFVRELSAIDIERR